MPMRAQAAIAAARLHQFRKAQQEYGLSLNLLKIGTLASAIAVIGLPTILDLEADRRAPFTAWETLTSAITAPAALIAFGTILSAMILLLAVRDKDGRMPALTP